MGAWASPGQFDCHLFYRRANALALSLGSLSTWEDLLIERMRRRNERGLIRRERGMNFDDTPAEAAFRADAAAWIDANAPHELSAS